MPVERTHIDQFMIIVGSVGLVVSLLVGVGGWVLAGRASGAITSTLEPAAVVITELSTAIGASQVMVTNTAEALEHIESSTRTSVNVLLSIRELLLDTTALAGGEIADSLDSAVDALPAIIESGRLTDRTLRALRVVGVDYDPEVALDEALTDLESSLAPIPDQLREQVAAMEPLAEDLRLIAIEAGQLTGVLFDVRIDLLQAEKTLETAAESAVDAAEAARSLQDDIVTYETLGRVLAVATALALSIGAIAPMLIGLGYLRKPE